MGFYLTFPVCSVQTFESLYDEKSKGVRRVCMRSNFSTGQNAGENIDNWRSPIKMEGGNSEGLYVKCRNVFALRTIQENSAFLRPTILKDELCVFCKRALRCEL